jgi:peptidyl-prolyl cis-trans isomerase C
MKTIISKSWQIIFVLFIIIMAFGCSDSGKKESTAVGANNIQSSGSGPAAPVKTADIKSGDIVASVDGKVLTKAELENNLIERFNLIKGKIPADKQKEFKENLRKQLIELFITRSILTNEIEKKNIQASSEEVKMAIDNIKTSLPPDKKIDDFFKENKITQDDIILAVKVEKYRMMEIGEKMKPSQKEISKFYNENRDKLFNQPESVHVRHILVAVGKDDNDKVKAEKKEKIDNIRKQLVSGGNFTELARKYSDCPSKEVGGDLSYIKKGQMVKEFENAAFSQEKNAIGPVIKTEYGYHIVQVLDKKPAKKVALEEVKDKISKHLEQRKTMEAFNEVLKKLRANAKVQIYQ